MKSNSKNLRDDDICVHLLIISSYIQWILVLKFFEYNKLRTKITKNHKFPKAKSFSLNMFLTLWVNSGKEFKNSRKKISSWLDRFNVMTFVTLFHNETSHVDKLNLTCTSWLSASIGRNGSSTGLAGEFACSPHWLHFPTLPTFQKSEVWEMGLRGQLNATVGVAHYKSQLRVLLHRLFIINM